MHGMTNFLLRFALLLFFPIMRNMHGKVKSEIYNKKWYIIHDEYSGWFVVKNDGSMIGDNGCNGCSYGKGSVFFESNGNIEWKVKGGPLCQARMCHKFTEQGGYKARKMFFLYPPKSIEKQYYRQKDSESLEIYSNGSLYKYSLIKPEAPKLKPPFFYLKNLP